MALGKIYYYAHHESDSVFASIIPPAIVLKNIEIQELDEKEALEMSRRLGESKITIDNKF